jgi:DNA (cytosine-5)-methyltransferase 1
MPENGASVNRRPRLLDLFCGAGGAAMGYHRAGFQVVGVDIEPQPRYPFEFIRADALTFRLDGFDAIHASPPCQRFSRISVVYGAGADHPDHVAATRARLLAAGVPYVIENVPGAPLLNPVMLCGSALGLPLRRHRLFESNVTLMSPGCAHGMHAKQYRIRQHGREIDTAFCYVFGGGQAGQPVATWRTAMGIDWGMTVDELSQAIPPAYTEHIGGYLLAELQARAAA